MTAAVQRMMRSATALLPARRGPFLALLLASTVSLLGSSVTDLAVPWFVLQTTGSAAKTGIAAGVTALSFLAAFFGGTFIDRLGFKPTSVVADVASGLAVIAIPVLYHLVGLAFWQLLLLVFARALCSTAGGTARAGLLPDLIALAALGKERANGAYQAVTNAANVAGAALAGVLIGLLGTSNVLWLDGASFLFSAGLVLLAVPASPGARPAGARDYRAELTVGLRFLRRDRLLWNIAGVATLVNFVGYALGAVVLPVYAKQVFGSPVALGLLYAAISGGSLAGALLFTALGARLPRRGTFVLGLLAFAVADGFLVLQPPFVVASAVLAALGIAQGLVNPIFTLVQQERVPASLRGRVFGAVGAIVRLGAPVGGLLAGFLLSGIGLRGTLAGMATGLLGIVLWAALNRSLRLLDSVDTAPSVGVGSG